MSWKFALVVASSIGLSACASRYIPEPMECSGRLPAVLSKVNLTDLLGKMTHEFCPRGDAPANPLISDQDIVVVPDYKDVGNFTTGHAGIVLGEVTRSVISEICKHRVRQVDLGKTIRLNEEGVGVLTRDSARLAKSEFVSKWGYVGTYAELPGKLVITLRELDMESGATTRIVSRELNHGCRISNGEYRFNYSLN